MFKSSPVVAELIAKGYTRDRALHVARNIATAKYLRRRYQTDPAYRELQKGRVNAYHKRKRTMNKLREQLMQNGFISTTAGIPQEGELIEIFKLLKGEGHAVSMDQTLLNDHPVTVSCYHHRTCRKCANEGAKPGNGRRCHS